MRGEGSANVLRHVRRDDGGRLVGAEQLADKLCLERRVGVRRLKDAKIPAGANVQAAARMAGERAKEAA